MNTQQILTKTIKTPKITTTRRENDATPNKDVQLSTTVTYQLHVFLTGVANISTLEKVYIFGNELKNLH